jgi:hypothetical protein
VAQHRVYERAYDIWEREGRPEGKAFMHWLQAEAELEELQFEALRKACRNEVLSCSRLAAALVLWRRRLRRRRSIVLPAIIILGAVGVLQVLIQFGGKWASVLTGLLILVTVGAIAIYMIVTIGAGLSDIDQATAEFFNLCDRFRSAGNTAGITGSVDDFAMELSALMDRKDRARHTAPAVPEEYILAAGSADASWFDDGLTK